MATLSMFWFGKGLEHFHEGDIDWENDTIKVALFTDSFTPNQATDEFFNALSNEVAGASEGYTSGGETLANASLAYAARVVTLDGDDVEYADGGSSEITAQYAVIYVDGSTPGTDDFLIGYGHTPSEESSSGAPFSIEWNASGILTTTATEDA